MSSNLSISTSGYFGLGRNYENPSDQRNYELNNEKQSKPRPIPLVKSVFDFHTPKNFGPAFGGQNILGDWRMNLISRWSAGSWFTYNPNNVPGIEYNVRYKNNYNVDLKFSKVFALGKANVKLYADILNVLNTKTFSGYGFEDGFDYNYYMQSLHMPESISSELGYNYFSGKDKPGDVRKEGTEFVPIEWVSDISFLDNPSERPIYYDSVTDSYQQWSASNGWGSVDQSFYDQVIRDKQYIDMPNQLYYVFLNPRDIFIGLSISYDF